MTRATMRDVQKVVAREYGCSVRQAHKIVRVTCDAIAELLAERGTVGLKRFGCFSTPVRKGRVYTHPETGAPYITTDTRKARFAASKALAERIAKQGGE